MKKYNLFILLLLLIFFNLGSVPSLSAKVFVPEKYSEVYSGERVYFGIEVKYPENPSRKDLILEYQILNSENEIIAGSKVLKAIETQASFMDFLIIPEGIKSGKYIIKIKIGDYEDLNQEISTNFKIIGYKRDKSILYFSVIIFTIIFMSVLIIISVLNRKKLRKKLYKRKRN